jgi:hypothetical protein
VITNTLLRRDAWLLIAQRPLSGGLSSLFDALGKMAAREVAPILIAGLTPA